MYLSITISNANSKHNYNKGSRNIQFLNLE